MDVSLYYALFSLEHPGKDEAASEEAASRVRSDVRTSYAIVMGVLTRSLPEPPNVAWATRM